MTEPEFGAASPCFAAVSRFGAAMGPWLEEAAGQDPAEVAEAIHRAVTDPACPFRQLVGPDALRMVPAYRDAPDFETFARGVLGPLGV